MTDESIADQPVNFVEADPLQAADLIELLATAVSASADYFNAQLDMRTAELAYNGEFVKMPPITALVNEAMSAWREWRFG